MAAETVELHKLKLAELKQECLARGLEAKGNKQDLINRLQAYLEEHAEEEANEEDVLGEEIEEEEPKPVEPPVKVEEPPVKSPDVITEKKVVKITSEISQMESEEDEKLKKRKERFGIVTSSAGAGATEDTESCDHPHKLSPAPRSCTTARARPRCWGQPGAPCPAEHPPSSAQHRPPGPWGPRAARPPRDGHLPALRPRVPAR
ncbi:SAP domain-containing ribonucleoprotein isoform X7 [Calonectris borealis]|uniref:SAP domain-containing ribonucleoprotein isoform X7 n=1 Tax=Calonectris borealis TaxID=1323832 RepID=UPI003F4B92AF